MDDSKIIKLFFERNEEAITALSAKHGNVVSKIATNVLGNHADAEECINDAYLAVWNSIPPAKPDSLRSYVCSVIRNIATTRYHYNTAEKRNSFYDVALDELEACIPDAEGVEREADKKGLSEALNEFLATLKDDECVMFIKRYWYSESVADMAKTFQATPHYISVKLHRTREKLRKFLIQKGIFI